MEESVFSSAITSLRESRHFHVADFLGASFDQIRRLHEALPVVVTGRELSVVFDGRVPEDDAAFDEGVNRIGDAYEVRWNGGGFDGEAAERVMDAMQNTKLLEDATFRFDAPPSPEVLNELLEVLAASPALRRVHLTNAGVSRTVRANVLDVMRKNLEEFDISGDNDQEELEYLRSTFQYRADVENVVFSIDGQKVAGAPPRAASPTKRRMSRFSSIVGKFVSG